MIEKAWNYRSIRFLIVVFVVASQFQSNPLFAQKNKVDSLLNIIDALPEDTSKVNFINQHYLTITNYNYSIAQGLAEKAKEIAEKLDYSYGLASSLENMGIYYWYNGYYNRANNLFKQVIDHGIESNDFRLFAESYNRIGLIFYYQAIYDSAEYYHYKALSYFHGMADSIGVARIWYHIGLLHYQQSEYEEAVNYYLKALSIYESHGKPTSQAKMLNKLSEVYQALGHTELIWEKQQELIALTSRESNKTNIALFNEQIGDIFFLTNSADSALVYFSKAVTQYREMGRIVNYDFVNEKIGKIYLSKGDYERALEYIERVYDFRKESSTRIHLASAERLMGEVYHAIGNLDRSISHYSRSMVMHQQMGNAVALAKVYRHIAEVYYDLGAYDLAIAHAIKGLEASKKISARSIELDNLKILSEAYFKTGDHETAYTYLNEYHKKNEVISKGKSLQRINHLQVRYNEEKSEREIAELKQREILQASKLQQQNLLVILFLILFLLILSISILLYNRYQLKVKNNLILSLKNQQFEKDNHRLSRKNKEGEILLAEIRHRIKNNLQTISSLLNMHSRNLSSQQKSLIQQSHDRVQAMTLIHQKLDRDSNYAIIDLNSYLRELTKNLAQSYGFINIRINFKISYLPVEADVAVHIGLIANELISNSLKHAFVDQEKPMLDVTVRRIDNISINMVIKDNGIGFTGDYSNEGSFGIKMISILIKELEGDLKFEDQNGTKVVVTMKCPVIKLKSFAGSEETLQVFKN